MGNPAMTVHVRPARGRASTAWMAGLVGVSTVLLALFMLVG